MNVKYLIISESTFGDNVSSEPVSLWSTYNKALSELADIAKEFDVELGEFSSFVVGSGNDIVEYYVTSMNEDES